MKNENGNDSMREHVVSCLRRGAWLDCEWTVGRGDKQDNAGYEAWLRTLDNDDLLAAYRRVTTAESQLD